MYNILLFVFVLISFLLPAIILLNQGKGTDMMASFKANTKDEIFESINCNNFINKFTYCLIILFFILSLFLNNLNNNNLKTSKWDNLDKAYKLETNK